MRCMQRVHKRMVFAMKSASSGFSLIEVLVALLVISIGLLGIAKMQALALSNTNGGRLRALAAIEAESMAQALQAERNYWGNITTAVTATIAGSAGKASVSSSDTTQNATNIVCSAPSSYTGGLQLTPCSGTGTVSCASTAAPCTAQKMAAYDLQQWAGRLQGVLGTDAATVNCAIATTTSPVTCQITVNWAEEQVNPNANGSSTAMLPPSYTVFVNP
jgi:type IV pilus assembly protein PilV